VFGTGNVSDEHYSLSFGPGKSSDAIGFYMFSQSIFPSPTYIITVTDMGGESLISPIALPGGGPAFFGFVSPDGIVSVEIDDDPADSRIRNFWFDNVSRAAIVPEPSALVLWLVGGCCLAAYGWCRRRP